MASVSKPKLLVGSLESFSIGQREFDREDVFNPGAAEVGDNLKSLCDKILKDPKVQAQLKAYGDDLDLEVGISHQNGVTLKVLSWKGLRSVEIFRSKDILKEAEWNTLAKAHKIAEEKGCGVVVATPSSLEKGTKRLWNGLKFVAEDINSELGDIGSVFRNFIRACKPNCAALPLMTSVGGYMMIVGGVWFCLKALLQFVIAVGNGDGRGSFEAMLHFIAFLGLIGFGVSMVFAKDILFDTVVGVMFYGFFGLVALIQGIKDVLFRYQMNQKFKSETIKDVEATLTWLLEQAKGCPAEFSRRTSDEAARRITNEVNDNLIERVRKGDTEALRQALYLIEDVSKSNFANIYANVLFLVISAFGFVSTFVPIVKIASIFYGVGAALWLLSGDMKLPDLKKRITNELWEKNKAGDAVWKKVDEIQKRACLNTPFSISSITSDPSGDSRRTA